MKRGGPIKRKTPLKRGTSSLKRTPLKRKGAKAEREDAALDEFRRVLRYRSQLECEVDDPTACGTSKHHPGVHPHHVWPEDRDAGMHDPERGLWVCAVAHRWIHEHPAAASEFGWLRPKESNT